MRFSILFCALIAGAFIFASCSSPTSSSAAPAPTAAPAATATPVATATPAAPDMTATDSLTGFKDLGSITATAAGNSWAAAVTDVQSASDGSNLYLAVVMNPMGGGNNLYVLVDDVNQTTGTTDLTSILNYGTTGITTNTVNANIDFGLVDFRSGSGLLSSTTGNNGHYLSFSGTGGATQTDVSAKVNFVQSADGTYKFSIPYSAIGAGAVKGDVLHVYVLFGAYSQIVSAWPAQSTMGSIASGVGLTTLDTADTGTTLK